MRESADGGRPAAVTVVVVTRNRAAELERTLRRLTALPERPAVVVVDNGSSDDSVARARGVGGVQVIAGGRNLGAAGRNLGARAASSPLIAFCDDDSWFEPGSIGEAARLLARDPRLALVAPSIWVHGTTLDPTCRLMARSPLGFPVDEGGRHRYILGFLACGAVLRRDAFLAVGGFAPWLSIGAEEKLLSIDLAAAGYRLLYAPEVVCQHHPSPRRDEAARRRVVARNELWIAALRRPARSVARQVLRTARGALADRALGAGLYDALVGLPRLPDRRRPLPAGVEYRLRALGD